MTSSETTLTTEPVSATEAPPSAKAPASHLAFWSRLGHRTKLSVAATILLLAGGGTGFAVGQAVADSDQPTPQESSGVDPAQFPGQPPEGMPESGEAPPRHGDDPPELSDESGPPNTEEPSDSTST